jgi:hypothetical protein
MPASVAQSLQQQAEECLRVAQGTKDDSVRMELLTAAAWLHEKAAKIEAALSRGAPPAT